jgi:hypothetical protein
MKINAMEPVAFFIFIEPLADTCNEDALKQRTAVNWAEKKELLTVLLPSLAEKTTVCQVSC